MRSMRYGWIALLVVITTACDIESEEDGNTTPNPLLSYELPGDIPALDQEQVDLYSWQTFLALNAPAVGASVSTTGDNTTQLAAWSSSNDMIRCNLDDSDCLCPGDDCRNSGSRYYPEACQAIEGYQQYRVIDSSFKADDSFLEAQTGGLSNLPLLDSRGNFLRYEILINPANYTHVVANRYYDWDTLYTLDSDPAMLCGSETYRGGDPANQASGSYTIKLAWMEAGLANNTYHTEQHLVFNPAYRNSSGVATCELKTMALVGMHIGHKTIKQPNYTWATFEHVANAPDCSGLPPAGNQGGSAVNTGCPAPSSLAEDFNFANNDCSDGSCADCNTGPASNAPQGQCQVDPQSATEVGWCLDLPPASAAGKSQLCLQVPIAANYPNAHQWNEVFAAALGNASVWSNYRLISTQWYKFDAVPTTCENTAPGFEQDPATSRPLQRPQINVSSPEGATRPFLHNSSMESYERANCNACHSKAFFTQADGKTRRYTDYNWWMSLETCAAWCELNSVDPCSCYSAVNQE